MNLEIYIDCIFNGKFSKIQIKIQFLFGLISKKIDLLHKNEMEFDEQIDAKIIPIINNHIKNSSEIHTIVKKLLKPINIRSFSWETTFGTGEAHITGITSGVISGLKGIIIGILNMYFTFTKNIKINVYPVYQGKGIYSELKVKLSIQLFRIISSFILIYFSWRKMKSVQMKNKLQFE